VLPTNVGFVLFGQYLPNLQALLVGGQEGQLKPGAYRCFFMKKANFVDILNRKQKIQLNHDEPRLQSGMLSREPQADCRRERQAAGFHPSVTTFQV